MVTQDSLKQVPSSLRILSFIRFQDSIANGALVNARLLLVTVFRRQPVPTKAGRPITLRLTPLLPSSSPRSLPSLLSSAPPCILPFLPPPLLQAPCLLPSLLSPCLPASSRLQLFLLVTLQCAIFPHDDGIFFRSAELLAAKCPGSLIITLA